MSLYQSDTTDPIWRAIAGRETKSIQPDPERLQALADLISAAGVAALIPDSSAILGVAEVRQARLLNRFRRLQGERWSNALTAHGITNMAMKGLASAHTVWPDADARAVSDADLLVAPTDLEPALDFFTAQGFALADMPTRGPWGFIGDASFQPLIGPDDNSNIDLHIQGDAHPFAKAVRAETLLSEAQRHAESGLLLSAPHHAFLIAASHAAGDLFTADAVKSVVDGLLMLRQPDRIDFPAVHETCRDTGMMVPVTAFLALLESLGGETASARDAGFRPEREAGRELDRVVAAHNSMFTTGEMPGALARLRREATLCADWRTVFHRNHRRLRGLVRPDRGRPPGAR